LELDTKVLPKISGFIKFLILDTRPLLRETSPQRKIPAGPRNFRSGVEFFLFSGMIL
jgi:hypothetical protein